MPNMLPLVATIFKYPDSLPEMSGMLDTRIQSFYNSANNFGQLVFLIFGWGTLFSLDPGPQGDSNPSSFLERPYDKCQRKKRLIF